MFESCSLRNLQFRDLFWSYVSMWPCACDFYGLWTNNRWAQGYFSSLQIEWMGVFCCFFVCCILYILIFLYFSHFYFPPLQNVSNLFSPRACNFCFFVRCKCMCMRWLSPLKHFKILQSCSHRCQDNCSPLYCVNSFTISAKSSYSSSAHAAFVFVYLPRRPTPPLIHKPFTATIICFNRLRFDVGSPQWFGTCVPHIGRCLVVDVVVSFINSWSPNIW